MTASSHIEMHRDHLSWTSEARMWRTDIAAWQHEVADAIAEIAQLKKALAAHEERLSKHAATIRLDEVNPAAHERALANFEQGGSGEKLPEYARQHSQEAERQARDRQAHEELKRLHHTILAQWRLLLKSLTEHAGDARVGGQAGGPLLAK